jgi:23S rRNA (guanosine2251-2'-O)-methyltransferase
MKIQPTRNTKRKPAASHQRSWLWGRHAILETVRAGKWPIQELFFADDLPASPFEELRQIAAAKQIRFQIVTDRRLFELCQSDDHQGFLARMGEFPCGTLEELVAVLKRRKTSSEEDKHRPLPPLFVICDRIQDAHNFGAILRCCDAMRVEGIVIGEKAQVAVTPHVARSSAGAVNSLAIFRVASLFTAIDEIRKSGLTVIAASEKSATSLWQANFRQPLALVIGSEAFGIATDLLQKCHSQVGIPMLGEVNSLNAAVAAGIVLYEIRRQQLA